MRPKTGQTKVVTKQIIQMFLDDIIRELVKDVLGAVRKNGDRVRNIVVLGNNTYGWTFKVRGEAAPEPRPHLKLTAPSGEVWLYNDPSTTEVIANRP